MKDHKDVESACLTDRPRFVVPLGVQPTQYHDGSGIENRECEGIFEAEKVIIELWIDVEGAGQCGV